MADVSEGLAPRPIRPDVKLLDPQPVVRLVPAPPVPLSQQKADELWEMCLADMEWADREACRLDWTGPRAGRGMLR